MAPIQAVTFDVGGTLIEPWPSVGHVYADAAARHGFRNLDPDRLNRRFAEAWHAKSNFDYSRTAWSEIVTEVFHGRGSGWSEVSFFQELYDRFARADVWRIYDDVLPTLARLRQSGLKLGVISNWDERLRPLLRALQIEDFFEVVVVSRELGAHKPSPAIFQEALRQLHLPGPAVLHIGDSAAEDVEGAKQAGLHALQLHRRRPGSAGPGITSLNELRWSRTNGGSGSSTGPEASEHAPAIRDRRRPGGVGRHFPRPGEEPP